MRFTNKQVVVKLAKVYEHFYQNFNIFLKNILSSKTNVITIKREQHKIT